MSAGPTTFTLPADGPYSQYNLPFTTDPLPGQPDPLPLPPAQAFVPTGMPDQPTSLAPVPDNMIVARIVRPNDIPIVRELTLHPNVVLPPGGAGIYNDTSGNGYAVYPNGSIHHVNLTTSTQGGRVTVTDFTGWALLFNYYADGGYFWCKQYNPSYSYFGYNYAFQQGGYPGSWAWHNESAFLPFFYQCAQDHPGYSIYACDYNVFYGGFIQAMANANLRSLMNYFVGNGMYGNSGNYYYTNSGYWGSGPYNSYGDPILIKLTVPSGSLPGAPSITSVTTGNKSITVNFTQASNGGNTITNYTYSTDGGSTFSEFSPAQASSPLMITTISSDGVTRLTNGTPYTIQIQAVNGIGTGPSSNIVADDVPSGPPDAPTIVSTTDMFNGIISVVVSGSDQGSAITNYNYSLDGGTTFTTFSPPQTSSPLTISGLVNRVNYSLVIQATNANGTSDSSTPLSLYYRCFLEGTKILCYDSDAKAEVERTIESLRVGDLVKTTMDGYKAIDSIGFSKIYNPANSMRSKNRLYRCSKENYPELSEDLVITGCHAILVKDLTDEERSELIEHQGKIFVTEDYYRLIACVDKRALPYEKEGLFNIWHFALENDNYYYNYGVFANGLKVETASERSMREMSGMNLL